MAVRNSGRVSDIPIYNLQGKRFKRLYPLYFHQIRVPLELIFFANLFLVPLSH